VIEALERLYDGGEAKDVTELSESESGYRVCRF
jgi:hypothetical protein